MTDQRVSLRDKNRGKEEKKMADFKDVVFVSSWESLLFLEGSPTTYFKLK